jgi:monoamine oxidase
LKTVVKKIDLRNPIVEVTDTKGKVYKGTGIILTVPVPVMQDGDIDFIPSLPDEKIDAINLIRMDAMGKLFVQFKERFWDDRTLLFFYDGFIGTCWSSGIGGISKKNNVLTFHPSGRVARQVSNMTDSERKEAILTELEKYFGDKPRKLFDKILYQDWTKEPYIRGGYSAPSLGEGKSRQTFLKPVEGKMMFAGEAYGALGQTCTVAAAIDSGMYAANYFIGLQHLQTPKL